MNPSVTVRRAGLIGYPVGHSISPQFQQAAFDALSLPVRYERWETTACELPHRMLGLRDDAILGANVTVPHKQAAILLSDDRAPDAAIIGAANTIVKRGGRLIAHNTDVGGFRRALQENMSDRARQSAVAVIGAGGAARAVIAALDLEGAATITVLNRSFHRAAALIAEIQPVTTARLSVAPLDLHASRYLRDCELVVNCTSVGLAGSATVGKSPLPIGALPPGAAVVDVIANPIQTPLLQEAAAGGRPVLGGLAMLIHQGALAFELWTGCSAPLDIMTSAARTAMGLDGPTAIALEPEQ